MFLVTGLANLRFKESLPHDITAKQNATFGAGMIAMFGTLLLHMMYGVGVVFGDIKDMCFLVGRRPRIVCTYVLYLFLVAAAVFVLWHWSTQTPVEWLPNFFDMDPWHKSLREIPAAAAA